MGDEIKRVHSTSGVGRLTVALLTIGVIVDCLAVLSSVAERDLLTRVAQGFVTTAELDSNDLRQAWIGMSQFAVFLVTGIVFLIWFHRSYKNLRAYGAELPHGTGWAIGGWFVPILNFFRPKSIANTIWQANDPDLPTPVGDSWEDVKIPAFVHFWWGMFVLSVLLYRLAAGLSDNIESIEQAQQANLFVIISDGVSAVAGILAIFFVKGVQVKQSAREQSYHPSVAVPT